MEKVIGRQEEKKLLREALKSKVPELIAVYGRRRVGKTFLIRQALQKDIVFEFTGTKEANLKQPWMVELCLDLSGGIPPKGEVLPRSKAQFMEYISRRARNKEL